MAAAQAGDGNDQEPDYEGLLAQHDVVYLTPVDVGPEGLPIGNGDLAATVWMPPNGVELAVNKSNLWDDRPAVPPLPDEWSWNVKEEEQWTSLVSGCRLKIRSRLPVLDPLFLNDFEARLKLYQALVAVRSESPFGNLNASTWVSRDPAVCVIHFNETADEPISREIDLSRWGSRRLFHFYSQYDPSATTTGLDGTRAGSDGNYLWIEQKLRVISFAVVVRFVGAPYETEVRSRHSAAILTEKSRQLNGTVHLSIVTSDESSDPLGAAKQNVDEAVAQGPQLLLDDHRRIWAGFWRRSYLQIPEDYFENLYYFSLYQLAAISQGKYPPHDCCGLWFWNHDIRRWGHYYQWNLQHQYWPVHASNHAELIGPYLEFRFRTLPQAEEYAKRVHSRNGALYADVTDRWGRGTVHHHVSYIYTTTTQIAMDFWRHYLYTQDPSFLRDRAYPVMKAAATFYVESLEQDRAGKYHIPRSTCYENEIDQKDTITDLAAIRQSFPACIQASEILGIDANLRERWKDVLENLVDFAVMDDTTDEHGNPLPKVFSSGIPLQDYEIGPDPNHRWETKRVVKKGERQFNISFFCETAPIFPSGVIGLAQKGTELFEVAVGTVRQLQRGPAWNLHPMTAAARLGLADEALSGLGYLVETFQKAPQGFFAQLFRPDTYLWDLGAVFTPAKVLEGRRTQERASLPKRWFDMPDLEVGGVLMTTINEMLLQTYDGTIRVFPALPAQWRSASFQLRAVGAFMITGEVQDGEIRPFLIESLAGAKCRVETPWVTEHITARDLATREQVAAQGTTIEFDTQSGSRYLVFRPGQPERLPRSPKPRNGPNQAPKTWRGRRLGIPRHF